MNYQTVCASDQRKEALAQFAFLWYLSTNFLRCQFIFVFVCLFAHPSAGTLPLFWNFLLLICRSLWHSQKIILNYKYGRYFLLLSPLPRFFFFLQKFLLMELNLWDFSIVGSEFPATLRDETEWALSCNGRKLIRRQCHAQASSVLWKQSTDCIQKKSRQDGSVG